MLLAAVSTAAGCTSSSGGAPPSRASGPSPSTATSATTGGPSTAPDTAGPAPTGSATDAPSGSAAPSTTPGSGTAACATVTTTAQRTPGATGRSFALLTFTNAGDAPCSLTGRPEVVLLDGNRQPVTGAAADGGGTATTVVLAPGAAASTLLVDDASTCTADTRSVYVRVTPPGGGTSTELPVALPPCSLSVKPVVAGTDPAP